MTGSAAGPPEVQVGVPPGSLGQGCGSGSYGASTPVAIGVLGVGIGEVKLGGG